MPGESLRKGAPPKGPPKHQNSFAFKHNKNSKKTRSILKIAHNGLCKRCNEKIEWRKKFRKYKPLTTPGICNGCKQRAVKRAYHTLCDSCAGGRGVCAKCVIKLDEQTQQDGADDDSEDEMDVDAAPLPSALKSQRVQKKDKKKDLDEEFEDDEEDHDEALHAPRKVAAAKLTLKEEERDEIGGEEDEDASMEEDDDDEDDDDEE